MNLPLTTEEIQILEDFFHSEKVSEGCFDYIALHGFLTGVATGDEKLQEEDWLSFIFDQEPDYADLEQKNEIEGLINKLLNFIQRNLYLGDDIEIPCSVTAADVGETNEFTDWCFGFLESIALNEDLWFGDDSRNEAVAELILPIGILSEQFIEPELEHLSNSPSKRQKLSDSVLPNIQNLYLLFRE